MNNIKRLLAVMGLSVMAVSVVPAGVALATAGGANVSCVAYTADPNPTTSQNPNHVDGSVGNADDKCPPGQKPDGSDNNNGYECDGNNGIGDGNPAHTVNCPTPPVVVPTTEPPVVTPTTEPPVVIPTTQPPVVTPTTEPPVVTPTTAPPVVTPTTEPPVVTPTTEPPVVVPTTQPPVVVPTTEPPVVVPTTEPPVVIPTTQPPFIGPVVPKSVVTPKPLPYTGTNTDTLMIWSIIGMGVGGALLIAGLRKPA